ncbi:hypothetical protein ACLB2K_072273 [Fragaria x ananassa]
MRRLECTQRVLHLDVCPRVDETEVTRGLSDTYRGKYESGVVSVCYRRERGKQEPNGIQIHRMYGRSTAHEVMRLSLLKRRDMDDGVEMDETGESGLQFSDEKYHDIVISTEDEDCLFEDAGKDTLEIMEDSVILIEDEEVGRDKSDEHGNSKSVRADDITDKTIFSSEWEVTMDDVCVVLALQMAQVPTSIAYEFIALQVVGPEFVGFMLKDLYNKLDEVKRNNMKRGDAESAIDWLRVKGREEGHFFGRFTPDWEGRYSNLFWTDSESLLDYNAFGDVVIIDSTYKTNIYSCPVILFVGSNNHRGTVVFAAAIVADEKEATLTWVIEKFLQSMNNKHPIIVLTDGDEVMRTMLKKIMPTTRHMLCAWHIGRNIGQNVNDVEVQKQLGKMLYASYTIDEWEGVWGDIVAKHGLEEDPWIIALYEKSDRRAEAFFRGNFCAGMCNTQICEGINGNIKTRVSRHTWLDEFLPRFHSGVFFFRNCYLLDDYKSKNHKRKFDSHLKSIEEDAFNTFTDDIFVVIKGHIMLENRFSVRGCVQFDGKYSCSCLQFESDGVPCAHLFCVLKYQKVSVYPKSLIEDRWTKGGGRLKMVPTAAQCVDEMSGRILRLTETSMKYREAKRPSVVELVVHPVPDNVLKDLVIARMKGMNENSVPAANAGNGNGGEGNRNQRLPYLGSHRSDKSGKPSKFAKTGMSENVGEHGYEENVPATSEFEGNEPNQSRNAYTMQWSPFNAVHTDTFVGDECHDNVKMADVNSQVGESCQINE